MVQLPVQKVFPSLVLRAVAMMIGPRHRLRLPSWMALIPFSTALTTSSFPLVPVRPGMFILATSTSELMVKEMEGASPSIST